MNLLRHPLTIAVLAACCLLLAVLAWSPEWTKQRLADRVHGEILDSDEATAVALVEQLAEYDAAATLHLVALLDDERPDVRRSARDAIRRQVEQWQQQTTAAGDERAAQLIAALAARPADREESTHLFGKVIALRLMNRSLRSTRVDPVQYLSDCQKVLVRTLESPTWVAAGPRPMMSAEIELPDTMPSDLPVAPVALPDGSDDSEFSTTDATEDDEPELSARDPGATGLLLRPDPRLLDDSDSESTPPRLMQPSEGGPPLIDEAAIRKLPTRSLMRHLHGIPDVAAAAEQELRRRGLDDATLPLARGLDHPDVQVRRRLVEAIPHVEGIDHSAWLWQLAEDADPTVRQAARNILSTSSNPLTRGRVR
jgi:hypothetical protein